MGGGLERRAQDEDEDEDGDGDGDGEHHHKKTRQSALSGSVSVHRLDAGIPRRQSH